MTESDSTASHIPGGGNGPKCIFYHLLHITWSLPTGYMMTTSCGSTYPHSRGRGGGQSSRGAWGFHLQPSLTWGRMHLLFDGDVASGAAGGAGDAVSLSAYASLCTDPLQVVTCCWSLSSYNAQLSFTITQTTCSPSPFRSGCLQVSLMCIAQLKRMWSLNLLVCQTTMICTSQGEKAFVAKKKKSPDPLSRKFVCLSETSGE